MAVKALFTYDYGKENMDKIRALGYEVILRNEKDLIYEEKLQDVEVLVCYTPFLTLDISEMINLKWIQLSSIGIDQLPMEKVRDKKVKITNNKGGYSIPMGEWIVLKILELFKQSYDLYSNQMNKKWKINSKVLEIYGKTIGFVGTGSIAKEAAKRLQGFDVKVLGMNTLGKKVEHFHECFSRERMEDMIVQCDVVVIAIPYTKETHHLMNEKKFNQMKEGAFLINVARGSIIEEGALITSLKSGKLGGAALDVVEEEPLKEESALWDFRNVSITPHNSWVSEERNNRRFEIIYENLQRYINGRQLINIVDLEKGY